MSIEDFILKHVKFIQESGIEPERKVKAITGLRRILFNPEYRVQVDAEYFYKEHATKPLHYFACLKWWRSTERSTFWSELSADLMEYEHRRFHN